MKIELLFLGTSEATPTKERGQTSILLRYKNENILIDCGEGTQRQMKIAEISPCNITRILITHWHGDHVLGLAGLLQTLGLNNYSKTLHIYGPKNTRRFLKAILNTFMFVGKIKIEVHEVDSGKIFENEDFSIVAERMKHSTYCLAYSFIEKDKRKIKKEFIKKIPGILLGKLQKNKSIKFNNKVISPEQATFLVPGKKITFILDTLYNENCVNIAKNSDILVSEATFLASEHTQKAEERFHLTAKQAGEIAKKAKVKALILTHISQRYAKKSEQEKILCEAKKIFKNTRLAEDFMNIELH